MELFVQITRSLVLFLFLGCISCIATYAKSDEPVSVIVPEGVADWVVHSASGRVFATLVDSDEVAEYSSDGKEVRRFKVGTTPTELILKNERLIVACTKSPALYVIDLKKNEVAGQFKFSGKGPYALFCSQVENDYVYCICNPGTAWWDGQVYQVDLKKMAIRKDQKIQGWSQSHALHVAMSHDGKWIVPDARGASSPSGADLMKVNEEEFTFTQVHRIHQSFGPISADPMNRYWFLGKSLYTFDLSKELRSFGGVPVAIHPNLDLVASMGNSGLMLERFSDASPIGAIQMPVVSTDSKRPNPQSANSAEIDTTVQFDLLHNLVFVGQAKRGTWVKFDGEPGKLLPLSMIIAPTEVDTRVDSVLRIPIGVTSSESRPNTKLMIAEGPTGARLEKNNLVWQPQSDDIGFVPLRLELKDEEQKATLDSATISVHVTLPKIDLGFHAKTMEVARGGRYAIVWGLTPGQESRHPAENGSDEVCIVDLEQLKIIARKTMPQGVRCATIDDKFVYISPNSGNLFYRLDHRLQQNERQFVSFAPQTMQKVADDQLAVGGDSLQFFDTAKWQPIALGNSALPIGQASKGIQTVGKDEILCGQVIRNAKTGKPLRILGISGLPFIANVDGRSFTNPLQSEPITKWGRRLQGNILSNHKNGPIKQMPGQRMGALSDSLPMAIFFSEVPGTGFTSSTLEFCNLIDGTTVQTAIIDVQPSNMAQSINFYGNRKMIVTEGNKLFCIHGKQILSMNISENTIKSLPMPVHFRHEQKTEIEVKGKVKFPLEIQGKKDGVTFSLLIEYPEVTIDSKSGEVTVDTEALWNQFKTNAASGTRITQFHTQTDPLAPVENAARYKELTWMNLPNDKFATQLPISAVLQDPEGQEDSIQFSLLILGPQSDIKKTIDSKKAVESKKAEEQKQLAMREQERKKLEKAQQEAAQRQAAANQANANNDKDLGNRVQELETRLRRMEAAIDSILKQLDKKDQPK